MSLNATFRVRLAAAIRSHPDKTLAICQRAGYDPSYVSRVLSGARPNPTLLFVESMAGALGVEVWDLLK